MIPSTLTTRWLTALTTLMLLVTTYVSTTTGKQIHVRPAATTATACPKPESCHTLQDIVQNPSQYFLPYTTFTFQQGYHKVNHSNNVLIKDVSNITLVGEMHASSVVQCISAFGLTFINVTNLTFSKLQFILCGAPIPRRPFPPIHTTELLKIVKYSATLYLIQVSELKLSDVQVLNSTGVGLLGINAPASISWTTFAGNTPNCILMFSDKHSFPALQHATQTITDSSFNFGSPQKNNGYASGLTIVFMQTAQLIHVTLSNVTAYSNKGDSHSSPGNMLFSLDKPSYKLQCVSLEAYKVNSTGAVGDSMVWKFEPITGKVQHNQSCNKSSASGAIIQIVQSHFSNNSGRGIYILNEYFYPPQITPNFRIESTTLYNNNNGGLHSEKSHIYLVDTNFTQNHNKAIDAKNTQITFSGNNTFAFNTGELGAITLIGCTVYFYGNSKSIGNKGKVNGAIAATATVLRFDEKTHIFVDNEGDNGGAISLDSSSELEIGGYYDTHIKFKRNRARKTGGAIFAQDSTIRIKSHTSLMFSGNIGYRGGALALIDTSFIKLKAPIQVQFLQNHAEHCGGAIYVNKAALTVCFFQIQDPHSETQHLVLKQFDPIKLENNTAQHAGSALYGGWVDYCKANIGLQYPVYGTEVFDTIFRKHNDNHDLSVVSSNPTRICVCVNSIPNCNITQYNVTAYPGEIFQIPAVAVGQRFGTVPFTVYARFVIPYTKAIPQMEVLYYTQTVEWRCTNLTYSIRSANRFEIMQLLVDRFDVLDSKRIEEQLLLKYHTSIRTNFVDFQMNITLQVCPLGFVFIEHSMKCECASMLRQHKIPCNISTQTVSRPTSFWINATDIDNTSSAVIVHPFCPFDYCKPESFALNLEDPDEQCAFHRSGILCGACLRNLSQVFGTSRCRECSSLWALLWVPAIALTGIALVVLLIVLNLTVSVGTINGLIFYANIVRANQATFFPPNTTNSFLSWFIAWINLDLGIETCFYNGLNAYFKTWLQFVFPLYIWSIALLIIVFSHYFKTAARLSGRSAVQVLATLFLLSYAKLLRIFITVFSFTVVTYPNRSEKVWLYDGNVAYLQGKHIPLFMAAIVMFLVISVPYTGALLFIQCFRRLPNHKLLSWIHKLKPFFDAYIGPYKDRHHYWTGLLLLVRGVLFLIFSANVIANPAVNLLVIILTAFSLLAHGAIVGQVYKQWYLNMIEYSYFLNLGVLAGAVFYTRASGQEAMLHLSGTSVHGQKAVVYTSVVIAIVTFTVIVMIQIVKKASSFKPCNWLISESIIPRLSKLRERVTLAVSRKHQCQSPLSPVHDDETAFQLRESLLEYCTND